MKSYIFPMVLASVGAVLMFHNKKNGSAAVTPGVPATHSTSWATPSMNLAPTKRLASSHAPVLPTSPFSPSLVPQLNPAFDKPYIYFQEELTRLNSCLEKKNCPFPNTDSRAYESAVYSEIVRTLTTLSGWQARHNYQDDRIPELMSVFLGFDHPYVKIEALKVMGTQKTDRALLDDILSEVIIYAQPEPIPYAMKELQRYTNASEKRKMDSVISKVLLTGGIYSAVEVAKNLAPLITPNNRPFYKGVLLKLEDDPMNEDIYDALSEALR